MTAEQRCAVVATIRWLLIRRQFEGVDPLPVGDGVGTLAIQAPFHALGQLLADVDHSSLLQRLLNGKEPLPMPPPLSSSYPWYEIVERGYALENAEFCYFYHPASLAAPRPARCAFEDLRPGDLCDIGGSRLWTVVGRLNDYAVEVSHERAPGRWRLTFVPDATFGNTATPYQRNGEEFYGPIRGDGYVLRHIEEDHRP